MTKKEMITKMQLIEAAAWLAYRQAVKEWGNGHSIANRRRSEWCAVSALVEEVGVKPDQWLPDNQAAFDIIHAKHAKQTAVA
jgi:hypothetical protein